MDSKKSIEIATGEKAGLTASPTLRDQFKRHSKDIFLLIFACLFYLILHAVFGTRFKALMQVASILGIAASGQTLVFLIFGADMSVSRVIAASAILTGTFLGIDGMPLVGALALVLLFGLVIGATNGTLIAALNLPPIIVTLGTQSIIYSIYMILTKGIRVASDISELQRFVNERFFAKFLTGSIVTWFVVVIVLTFILNKTRLGKSIYAVGSNKDCAAISGINVMGVTVVVYALCGMLAALSGFLLLGYLGTTSPTMGDSYLFPAIVALLLGGTSPLGGKGTVVGTMIGTFLITNIESALMAMKMSTAFRTFFEGIIILVFIIINNTDFSAISLRKKNRVEISK